MWDAGSKDFAVSSGSDMVAPAGSPRPIIDHLHGTLVKRSATPMCATRWQGTELLGSTTARICRV